MDAADEAIYIAYDKVISENKDILDKLVARPDINIESIDEKRIVLKFVLTMRPEVKLGKYTDLGVKKAKATATKKEIEEVFKEMPSFQTKENIDIITMLTEGKVAQSKREAREFVNAGSITINEEKITDENYIITKELAIEKEVLVVKRGKKKYFIGKIK